MEKSVEELYQEVKRFDEGDIYQSQEYDAIAKNQRNLYERMCALFGSAIVPFLEEYTAVMGDAMELEGKHFFEQGYLMGQK